MANFWEDLRYSLRSLLKSPGFTSLAVLTMALGIGANAAIFSVINGVLLHPLPYEEPDRLVRLWGHNPSLQLERGNLSPPDVDDLAAQNSVFESVAALTSLTNPVTAGGEAVFARQAVVSLPFFRLLGVKPALGRFFTAEEGKSGHNQVLVLSNAFWKRQFGGDPHVLGRLLTVKGLDYTIVGVAPADFKNPVLYTPGEVDMWRPLVLMQDPGARGGHWLSVVARLKPGVTVAQAQQEVNRISLQLEKSYPETNTGWGVHVEPLLDSLVGEVRPALLLLFTAVGLVLLIACVDLANLMLVRASSRQQFYVIRVAFGCRQHELIRQLLTESALLALAGGACGLLFAFWLTRWLRTFSLLPRQDQIGVDWRVIVFTFGVSLLTGLLFGLVPALRMSRPDLHEILKEGGRGASGSARRRRFRDLLVVAETALSLVLLIGAGLMLKSFHRLQGVDAGFAGEHLLTLQLSIPPTEEDAERIRATHKQFLEHLSVLPGVDAVGLVNSLPLSGAYSCDGFKIPDRPPVTTGHEPCADTKSVSPDYFRAMGIPLLRGRPFTSGDVPGSPPVVIINRTMASRFWPGEDPLGRSIIVNAAPRTIVGIIGDVRHLGLDVDVPPEVYLPSFQASPLNPMFAVLRTKGDPHALAAEVRPAISSVRKDTALFDFRTMEEVRNDSIAQPRLRTLLTAAFAVLSLVLAAVGVFSVMAYSVIERTHEIGIRMAIGAHTGDVLKIIFRQAMLLALGGIVLGLAGAFALTRVLARFLFGVSTTDPTAFIAGTAVLASVAFLAAYLPALRATRVSPMQAFRS
jgi:putative ABC transport system permease protein